MNRLKLARALKFSIIGLIIVTIVLFALGIQTLIVGLAGAISGPGESGMGLKLVDDDPSGDWLITLDANPANNGLLGERLAMSIGILDKEGKYIAVDSAAVSIAPGQHSPFSLELVISAEDVQKHQLNSTQGDDVKLELLFSIRTLGDLLGFQQTMRIAGGNVTIES